MSFRAPKNEGGGAAVFAGKTPDGGWGFWFGTQNVVYRLVDLPGDLRVCADGGPLNVRASASTTAPVVASLKEGEVVHAEQFILTEPGDPKPGGANGNGWYRVTGGSLPAGSAWVYSRFTSDARLGSCDIRNAIEKP